MTIIVKRRETPFSIIDNRLFGDLRLSLDARLVLAWMLSRGDGFIIMVEPMRRWLGISERVWQRVKHELVRTGYYIQTRSKGEDGKIRWTHKITDIPLDDIPSSPTKKTIPTKCMDGERMDANCMDAKRGDYKEEVNDFEVNKNEEENNNNVVVERVLQFSDGSRLDSVPQDWCDSLKSEAEAAYAKGKIKRSTIAAYARSILKNWQEQGKASPTQPLPKVREALEPVVDYGENGSVITVNGKIIAHRDNYQALIKACIHERGLKEEDAWGALRQELLESYLNREYPYRHSLRAT